MAAFLAQAVIRLANEPFGYKPWEIGRLSVTQVLKLLYHPRDKKDGSLVFDHWRDHADPRDRHRASCLYGGITDPADIERAWRDQFQGERYVPPLDLPEDWNHA